MKDYFIDTKKHINIEFQKKNNEKTYNEYEKGGKKTAHDFYKKTPKILNNKNEIVKPFINSQKKYQNTFIQTNNIGNNNNKINRKELLYDINAEDSDNYTNVKNIQTTQENNNNAIDCNVINLNLLDLPKNSNITSLNDYLEKSFQNKSKSIKSLDKTQLKISPIFGRTAYGFYNLKETGKKHVNLYSNDYN